jgi:iron(III)-enterobactin esterase
MIATSSRGFSRGLFFGLACWALGACTSSNGSPSGSGGAPPGQGGSSGGGAVASGAGGTQAASGGGNAGGTAAGPGGVITGAGGSPGTGGGAGRGGAAGGTGPDGAVGGGGPGGTASGGTTGANPGTDGDGDFMVGPTYATSSDLMQKGAPAGQSFHFTMSSATSQYFTGMNSTLQAANQHTFTRGVDVYVPAKYKDGTAAPFMVIQDGPGQLGNVKLALDNLTQGTDPTRLLPAFVAIAVASGGGDGVGSERGLEYDTVSDLYVRFVEGEVLPAVLANTAIKAAYPNFALTTDPDGRAAIGCSSGSAAAFTMGWFRPDLFHRIVTYSGTFVAQQNPAAPEHAMYPYGAWDYHSDLDLVANTAPKPLRVFINANQMDNGAGTGAGNEHDWLLANQRMAAALKGQGYHYRFVEGLGASHCDGRVQNATLPDTLLWLWRGYPIN